MRLKGPRNIWNQVIGLILVFLLTSCNSKTLTESDEPFVAGCEIERANIVESDSLAAYYPLDEDFLDYSGNCRHAEGRGVVQFIDGVSGKAALLNGSNSHIRIGPLNSVLPATRYTVILWFQGSELGRSEIAGFLSWTGACLSERWFNSSAGTHWGFEDCGDGGLLGLDSHVYQDWIMITVRSMAWSQNENDFDFHKIEHASLPWFAQYEPGAGEIIGNREILFGTNSFQDPRPTRQFKGLMDEIRIYNRRLSSEEERRIFDHYVSLLD